MPYILTLWSLVLKACTKIKWLDMLSMLCIYRFYMILTVHSICLLYNINWVAFIEQRLFSLCGRHWMFIQIIFSPYHFYPPQQTSQRWPRSWFMAHLTTKMCMITSSRAKDGPPFGCGTLVLPICHLWRSSLSTLLTHVCQVLHNYFPPYLPQQIPLFLLPFQPLHKTRDIG